MKHNQPAFHVPLIAIAILMLLNGCLVAESVYYRRSYIVGGGALIPERYHPSLVALPDGALVCAWSEGSGPQALDTSIRSARREPGDSVWSLPGTAAEDPGYADSHPALICLPDSSLRLVYATLYREKRKAPPGEDLEAWHLKYADSRDNGRTWGGDFFLIPRSGLVPSGPPVKMSGERFVLPLLDIRRSCPCFLDSRDGGSYWEELPRPESFAGLRCDGLIREDPGKILAVMSPLPAQGSEKRIRFAGSADSGLGWSAPESSVLPNPGGPVAVLRLANGHLVLAFNDHEYWLTPLTVAVSTDNGGTWTARRNIETGQWDNRDPALAQTADSRIHLVFVSRNINLEHVEFTESWLLEDN